MVHNRLNSLLLLLRWLQDLEGTQQTFVDAHHCSRVVKLAAVVWCAEQCNQLPLTEEFVTILDDLMSTADEIHIVFL
jgi:hypothetical protein